MTKKIFNWSKEKEKLEINYHIKIYLELRDVTLTENL